MTQRPTLNIKHCQHLFKAKKCSTDECCNSQGSNKILPHFYPVYRFIKQGSTGRIRPHNLHVLFNNVSTNIMAGERCPYFQKTLFQQHHVHASEMPQVIHHRLLNF